ncbi:vegetative cell wall protein gp1 [Teratosphaeria destructans]|uniref:Vegetative cell wall protein gp1 n=1 Tax=Teratosphaeria destructans TaxID=418781 RepID=A0A9W7W781_9PEZI|nr:vegetative cell wall protein gp1 [Teratosphaeria destructans]
MFQTAGYATHPPHFTSSYYTQTPPRTPQNSGDYPYYSTRHYSYTPSPQPKGHARRSTADYTYATKTSYATPRETTTKIYYTTTPDRYASAQSTPQRRTDYVSGSGRKRDWYGKQRNSKKQYYDPRLHHAHVFDERDDDPGYEYLPRYEQYEQHPPPYSQPQQRRQSYQYESRADHRYYDQVPIYTAAEPDRTTRPRRSSYSASKPARPTPPPRPRTSTAHKPPPKATEEDARRAGIPAGYSYKNWDPTEEPILLLGSVFDANSLGKWIYDWAVFFYGAATPIVEMAGELWLLLIQLAGKIKRAEDSMSRIRQTAKRDLVDDFLESGERLWQRFNKLLKLCENYMWKAAKKESKGTGEKITMGKNSGCEFVDSMFGRHRELERTEKLMTGMRLWSMRFDANCEDILRNPSA